MQLIFSVRSLQISYKYITATRITRFGWNLVWCIMGVKSADRQSQVAMQHCHLL